MMKRIRQFITLLLFCPVVVYSQELATLADYEAKYAEALQYYKVQKYNKALAMFEEIDPFFRGRQGGIDMLFNRAYCSFYTQDYQKSAALFGLFRSTYPRMPQVEEAMYREGCALALLSPVAIERDQTYTQEAIAVLQHYLACYPEGVYCKDVQEMLDVLYTKMAQKAFKQAQLYHQLGYYPAAIFALTVFQQEFPMSCFSDQAAYLQIDAQYRLARASKKGVKQQNQFQAVVERCQVFSNQYSASTYALKVSHIYKNSVSRLTTTRSHILP